MEKATFGAGCFWGVEARFLDEPGVTGTEVGYMGGSLDHPTYKDVCTDATGHAEVVRVAFDGKVTSYRKLLRLFFSIHDPTQVDRQGPDIGAQYRSVIFCHDEAQKREAEAVRAEVQRNSRRPIATVILPAKEFWRAEEYHQRYYDKSGRKSCGI